MRIVLDTNVLVSGLLNPSGAPGRLVDLVIASGVQLVVDDRILGEYRTVLARGQFAFSANDVRQLLAFLEDTAEPILAVPVDRPAPDADDLPFIEVALTGGADALVTGNARHFPPAATRGIFGDVARRLSCTYKSRMT